MHGNVPVRFGRGRLDSLVTKGLAAYLIASFDSVATIRTMGRAIRGADYFRTHLGLVRVKTRTDARR